ncbi:hypothetical protein [Sphingomonas sp.]|uniref:hypothetical protein n=1 Tax=Sphingomonas sp. TaxID=28214 RepID=UPI003F704CD2
MSQPVSRFLHPFDIARHPRLEPEVRRAILARWACEPSALPGKSGWRPPSGTTGDGLIDEDLSALRSLNQSRAHRMARL